MGYTHYWSFKAPARGQALKVELAYQRALKDCAKVIKAYQAEYPKGHSCRLSGYSAHAKGYGGLHFNGSGSYSHEDFTMREHYKQNLDGSGNHFCKTARKPYDEVVVACLTILKHYLKDNFVVHSDGRSVDWTDGVSLASRVIPDIGSPIEEERVCVACGK